jgi:hypothetical protein
MWATCLLPACCCVHLQTKAGKPALSTVAEEIADNLVLMMRRFQAKTAAEPVLVMDNARIQSCIPADCIQSNHGDIYLTQAQRVKLPAHSPDLNQPAEQAVGAVKGDVIQQVAKHVQVNKKRITAAEFTNMGKKAAENFAEGKVFAGGVKKSVHRMPDVWAVIAADEGVEVHIPGHHKLHGTAGDWAPPELR